MPAADGCQLWVLQSVALLDVGVLIAMILILFLCNLVKKFGI